MVNYSLTRFTDGMKDSVDGALASIETSLETVSNTFPILFINIVKEGSNGNRPAVVRATNATALPVLPSG